MYQRQSKRIGQGGLTKIAEKYGEAWNSFKEFNKRNFRLNYNFFSAVELPEFNG
jgi:hypothetical protein